MKSKFYLRKDSGLIKNDWLKSRYSFNFQTMDEFEKIKFGEMRILNNDTIIGGSGFGIHMHKDMEIVTIPIAGGLIHKDNLGNEHKITPDDVQIMSAGTGIFHSEYNLYQDQATNFLQIWIFPNRNGHDPRYAQATFSRQDRKDVWQSLVSPSHDTSLYLNQNATVSRIELSKDKSAIYSLSSANNGVLFYLINGNVKVNSDSFDNGDAFGYMDFKELVIEAKSNADILALEVPVITN